MRKFAHAGHAAKATVPFILSFKKHDVWLSKITFTG